MYHCDELKSLSDVDKRVSLKRYHPVNSLCPSTTNFVPLSEEKKGTVYGLSI